MFQIIQSIQFTSPDLLGACNKMNLKIVIFVLTTLHSVQSANILCCIIRNSRSHFNVANTLMHGLAANGHNVKKINTKHNQK